MCCFNSSLHSNHLSKLKDMENLNTKSSPKARDEVLKYQVYYDKYNKAFQKANTIKENTKPQEIKLRTQERAIKRAMFNYEVATKLYIEEQQKKQQERLEKMIEEEEIRMLRKEMIPRAKLMPFFDRPFFPQRSNRALTVPREPSFRMMSSKCSFSKKTSGKYLWLLQSPTESSSQSH